MPSIVSTTALDKRFGGIVATQHVDLDIPEGELRCIIGPNGAGKSTLFALLCGIHAPDSGHIFLKDRDITALPSFRRVRLGLGLTFQTNRAFHDLTVRQNLEAPFRLPRGGPLVHIRGTLPVCVVDLRSRYDKRCSCPGTAAPSPAVARDRNGACRWTRGPPSR